MTPEKAARANSMYRAIQLAHVQCVMETHHSPSLDLTLASYQTAFDTHIARPGCHVPENVLRFLSAEAAVIGYILTECYDADKQGMLENLERKPGLLEKMPVFTDFLPLGAAGHSQTP